MTERWHFYDRRSVLFHWWTAGLVLFQWGVGTLNRLLPKGPLRLDIWSVHVLVGFALVVVIALRIVWRLTHGRHLAPRGGAAAHRLAETMHALLYIVLVGTAGLGVVNVLAHGFPLFGLWSFPKVGGADYAHVANGWHRLFANLLMAFALAHALAGLFHRYVLRDHILDRMTLPRE